MKKITNSQILGELGETVAKEAFLRLGFGYDCRGRLEAGVDGIVELRDPKSGQPLGKLIGVQVKATEKGPYSHESDAEFQYLIRPEDLSYWRGANLPIIIVLYRQEDETLYWKHVEGGVPAEPRRLIFSKASDLLGEMSRDRLGSLTIDRSQHGTYLPPLGIFETAELNLIRIRLPDEIFVGESPFHSGRDGIPDLLKEQNPQFDWVIRGRRFYSFRDPRQSATACLVDEDSVEAIETELIADSDDPDNRLIMIELLRRSLQEQTSGLLSFGKDGGCLYFKAPGRFRKVVYNYRSSKNDTRALVVSVYRDKRDTSSIKSVRHHAFIPRFEQIAGDWYLSVTPTFVFTVDGFQPHRFSSSLLAGKKKLERNSAIRGQFFMWKHLLISSGYESRDLLSHLDLSNSSRILRFENLESLAMPKAVPEDAWQRCDPNANRMQAEMDWLL